MSVSGEFHRHLDALIEGLEAAGLGRQAMALEAARSAAPDLTSAAENVLECLDQAPAREAAESAPDAAASLEDELDTLRQVARIVLGR